MKRRCTFFWVGLAKKGTCFVLESCGSSEEPGHRANLISFKTNLLCAHLFLINKRWVEVEESESLQSLDFIDERVTSGGTDMNSDKGDFDLSDEASHTAEDFAFW